MIKLYFMLLIEFSTFIKSLLRIFLKELYVYIIITYIFTYAYMRKRENSILNE